MFSSIPVDAGLSRNLALVAILSAFNQAAQAQAAADAALPAVVVSANRFAGSADSAPIGATVITDQQIRQSGASSVSEAIRKIGGVYGRQSFVGSSDFSLDLRGFGTNSDQNLVILLDGVRLSENELVPAMLSSIPIDAVERIEIVRGGSSVLYGEGATGGTIHIVTKRARANTQRASVFAQVGNFDHRELRGSVSRGWETFALDATLSTQRADNYRDNNAIEQHNFSGGAQWWSGNVRAGLRIDAARQDARLPGTLTLAQFNANPRLTVTPNDFGVRDVNRYTAFIEQRTGNLNLAAELSHREQTSRGVFVSAFGTFDSVADVTATQFSPRMRYLTELGGWESEWIAGLDFAQWRRDTFSIFGGFPTSDSVVKQDSRALYARNDLRRNAWRIAAGARYEQFDKDARDPLAFPPSAYQQRFSVNAWDLQASYDVQPALRIFGKLGKSYRVANADENGFTLTANQPLLPQTSRDMELGAKLGDDQRSATVRVFRHRLRNEIFFDPTAGAFGVNVNLDPTRRQGVELEGSYAFSPAWRLSGVLQHVSAEFTGGPNAGREMVLVPRNVATLRASWTPSRQHVADLGVQWVSSQRYGNDFANTCVARVPSFATLDGRYAYRTGPWEFALAGTNLTDRDHFSNAFGCQAGIYPANGRQLKLSARLDF